MLEKRKDQKKILEDIVVLKEMNKKKSGKEFSFLNSYTVKFGKKRRMARRYFDEKGNLWSVHGEIIENTSSPKKS